jgi:hypothetical protein
MCSHPLNLGVSFVRIARKHGRKPTAFGVRGLGRIFLAYLGLGKVGKNLSLQSRRIDWRPWYKTLGCRWNKVSCTQYQKITTPSFVRGFNLFLGDQHFALAYVTASLRLKIPIATGNVDQPRVWLFKFTQ